MNLILDLSVKEQVNLIAWGRGIPEDLREAAAKLLSEAPSRLASAHKMLAEPGQTEEYYDAWRQSVALWQRVMRVCDPARNSYLQP